MQLGPQCDVCVPADPLDLALQSAPLSALLGKAAVVDYGTLDPALRRRDKGPKNPRVAKAEHRDVRRLGQFGHGRVAGMTEDGRVARIDRVYPAGEPDPIERGNDASADRRLLRCADHGDRPGLKQRFKPHRPLLPKRPVLPTRYLLSVEGWAMSLPRQRIRQPTSVAKLSKKSTS